MRIVVIGITHPFRGGIAHHTTCLSHALSKHHDVTLLSLTSQYPSLLFPGQTQIDHSDNAFTFPNRPLLHPLNPLSWLKAWRLIRRITPDLVIIPWWHPYFAPMMGTLALLLQRFGSTQVLFLCHNAQPHESSWIDGLLLRYAYAFPSGFLVHSHKDRQRLQRYVTSRPIMVHPHPVYEIFTADDPPDRSSARERLGVTGKKVVLCFGYIRRYKGVDVLLECFLNDQLDQESHLLLVGEFYDDRDHYQKSIDRLLQQNRLTLVDRYVSNEEVPLYFSAADLVAAPYLSASQSGVIQIARAFNTPVVASDVGGLTEMIQSDRSSWLCPPGDPEQLALTISKAFTTLEKGVSTETPPHTDDSWHSMVSAIETFHNAQSKER
ncbi:MAG: glycosyltransferase [Magnetococcales bacterium]|nr:glycosyltransferase [Magnetococcales bacterium]